MSASYKKLWKLLIDKDMSRAELRRAIHVSPATAAKMSKGDLVSSDVLARICKVLNCDLGDIVTLNADHPEEESQHGEPKS